MVVCHVHVSWEVSINFSFVCIGLFNLACPFLPRCCYLRWLCFFFAALWSERADSEVKVAVLSFVVVAQAADLILTKMAWEIELCLTLFRVLRLV